MDHRKLLEKSLISDPPSGLLRLLNFFSVISVIQRADQRSDISPEVFSDPQSGLLRLLKKSSVISVIQRMDQRKLLEKSLISDPPSGLRGLLNFFFSNLSNPKGGSEIRDFSGSFL